MRTSTKQLPTSSRRDELEALEQSARADTRAAKIGEAFTALTTIEISVQESLEKVARQWFKIGAMLIDVNLQEKNHFNKWIKANQATLGFARTKAYHMMKFATDSTGMVEAIASPLAPGYFPPSLLIGVEKYRLAARERAKKSREKINDKIAAFEALREAEYDKRHPMKSTSVPYHPPAPRQQPRPQPQPQRERTSLFESGNVVSIVDARGSARSPLERAWNHATEQERAAFVKRFHNDLAALLASDAAVRAQGEQP